MRVATLRVKSACWSTTVAPDSEGTLGGIVGPGKPGRLAPHGARALEDATPCASDPLCAEHAPGTAGSVQGAACHARLFAPETACERGRYHGHALLLPTVAGDADAAFFAPVAP